MSTTVYKGNEYRELRTPVVPQPVSCAKCGTMYGQMIRINLADKALGYTCRKCRYT